MSKFFATIESKPALRMFAQYLSLPIFKISILFDSLLIEFSIVFLMLIYFDMFFIKSLPVPQGTTTISELVFIIPHITSFSVPSPPTL
ncbi:hypothetical protein D3C76_1631270 [compost metagenome]